MTFGGSREIDGTADTSKTQMEESKDNMGKPGSIISELQLDKQSTQDALPQESSVMEPGANLPPQLQAEGEAIVNELMEFLKQDLHPERMEQMINRVARRQQGK